MNARPPDFHLSLPVDWAQPQRRCREEAVPAASPGTAFHLFLPPARPRLAECGVCAASPTPTATGWTGRPPSARGRSPRPAVPAPGRRRGPELRLVPPDRPPGLGEAEPARLPRRAGGPAAEL